MSEEVVYQRLPELPGLILSSGTFDSSGFERHYHLDYHVGLVTAGVQRQHCASAPLLLEPGSISLMPPGEIHDGQPEGGQAFSLQTFRLSPVLMQQLMQELSVSQSLPELAGMKLDNPKLASQLQALHAAMQQPGQRSALALQSEWLASLYFLFTQSRIITPRQDKGALSAGQWQRITEYCYAHLAEKITLDELAALCGLGRFHFLRQFKQRCGMTPHAWLLRLRLEQACGLLALGRRSIADVAHAVGFYDQSHFNRSFRQAFGVAPSAY